MLIRVVDDVRERGRDRVLLNVEREDCMLACEVEWEFRGKKM